MSEWWESDAAIDNHYRDHWESIYGYDPMDPVENEDDLEEMEE